jgi:glycine cleavage system aminomethyltransferase T
MGYVQKQVYEVGAKIKIGIRDQMKDAEIIKLPFYKRSA